MKRDREKGQSSSSPSMALAKGKKMWQEDNGGGMDELLAVLGYKVKAEDLPDVAQKLEQLEMVMDQEDGISLLSDSVHYNPSDLSGWVQSMLSELNAGQTQQSSTVVDDSSLLISAGGNNSSSSPCFPQPRIFEDNSEYDLSAIPGGAICKQKQSPVLLQNQNHKRIKTNRSDDPVLLPAEICPGSTAARPVVLVDSQETGVRLVHTLIACAEAVQQENLKLADTLVKHIGFLAVAQAGAMRKVATYFAEALARRIYNFHRQDLNYSDLLQMHFYETCPYLKFAHFTANQAILEAFEGETRVHVVDFGLKQGMQWPALMQALALRPGGPPKFRLTGIGPPQADDTDALQEVGWKLAQLAETIGVEFECRGFVVNSLADLNAEILDIRPREVEKVAVNSVFELHQLLALPGSIDKVLDSIKRMRPKIVTVVEQEANHNGSVFVDRFNEALHYYSTMFDSLEGSGLTQANSQDVVMSEVYLGRQICNVVACEGADRVERHETLSQWRARMGAAGFESAHLGSNAFKQASMLLALFGGGDGYRVEENDGCLKLGWHTRPLIATSAWQLAAGES
ncbi:hypothetical protein RHSIM_Rhsim08G0018400 [Rhododendron simsii]|uniref:DELLA protein n=1 Tax=Rhododendron simsii TaxID=118357 RepID=A0A834GJZ1_RHOSS|nr:hypothetical protein RHSIM_Rhsim08G0018400 [Rhododendron simsii]